MEANKQCHDVTFHFIYIFFSNNFIWLESWKFSLCTLNRRAMQYLFLFSFHCLLFFAAILRRNCNAHAYSRTTYSTRYLEARTKQSKNDEWRNKLKQYNKKYIWLCRKNEGKNESSNGDGISEEKSAGSLHRFQLLAKKLKVKIVYEMPIKALYIMYA